MSDVGIIDDDDDDDDDGTAVGCRVGVGVVGIGVGVRVGSFVVAARVGCLDGLPELVGAFVERVGGSVVLMSAVGKSEG